MKMDSKPTVLIIEDEEAISNFISAVLTSNQYQVIKAKTGKEGLSLFTSHIPDLILLDLGLPDMDGVEILKNIRSWSKIPIIVVSARGHEREKVAALDLGADEYLVKPFSPREIVARVNALFRRIKDEGGSGNIISFNNGELIIDHDKREVRLKNEEVALTPIEFDILSILSSNPGIVLTRETLIDRVLGPDFEGVDRTIDVHIKNIRKKIEEDTKNPSYIITVFKLGYKFGGGQ